MELDMDVCTDTQPHVRAHTHTHTHTHTCTYAHTHPHTYLPPTVPGVGANEHICARSQHIAHVAWERHIYSEYAAIVHQDHLNDVMRHGST